MGRTSEDYGIYGLDDATLNILAGDLRRYGEKGKYAQRELAQRQGLLREADTYRSALEKAAYGDAGAQYGQGLNAITNYLAGAGPMADSGGATALRAKLASQVYGQARSRIGSGYADFLKQSLAQRKQYQYQLALQKAQKGKKNPWGGVLGAAGAVGGAIIGGPAGAYAGYNVGSGLGGGSADNYSNYGYG